MDGTYCSVSDMSLCPARDDVQEEQGDEYEEEEEESSYRTSTSSARRNLTESSGKGCSCVPNFIFDFYGRTMIEDNYYFYYFNGAPSEEDIEEMETAAELEKVVNEDTSDCYCVHTQ